MARPNNSDDVHSTLPSLSNQRLYIADDYYAMVELSILQDAPVTFLLINQTSAFMMSVWHQMKRISRTTVTCIR
jgi:hypothetical protein